MALEVINLCKFYGRGEKTVRVLDDLNFRVERGELVAIAGKHRSGKSVLLNILEGLDKPSYGEVLIEGNRVTRGTFLRMGRYRSRDIGIITKEPMLLPEMTILDNVMLPLQHRFLSGKTKKKMAREALRNVGLKGKGKYYPHELTALEQQLSCTARAIVHKPKFIFADEPTACLDSNDIETYMAVLEMLATATGCGIIVATCTRRVATLCRRIIPVNGQNAARDEDNASTTESAVPNHTLAGKPSISKAQENDEEDDDDEDEMVVHLAPDSPLLTRNRNANATDHDDSPIGRAMASEGMIHRKIGEVDTEASVSEVLSPIPEAAPETPIVAASENAKIDDIDDDFEAALRNNLNDLF